MGSRSRSPGARRRRRSSPSPFRGKMRSSRSPPRRRIRSKSPQNRRKHSPSPSPPRSKQHLDSMFPAAGSRTRSSGGPIFQGSEFAKADIRELKKIQVDIRRNIPSHKASRSPIRRNIEHEETIVLPRNKAEGKRPIFERDEILNWQPEEERRSINVVDSDRRVRRARDEGERHRSRSPIGQRLGSRGEGEDRKRRGSGDGGRSNIKDRLGERRGGEFRDRRGNSDSFRRFDDRRDDDRNRAWNRQEMESRRPDVKPWEIDPEYVPKGHTYYEHDDRQEDLDDGDMRGGGGGDFYRGRGRSRFQRGGYFPRGRGGGGFSNDRYNNRSSWGRGGRGGGYRADSPREWKHDKYDDNQEPTSTTDE